jgi:phosphatidate cytidylyltransferase
MVWTRLATGLLLILGVAAILWLDSKLEPYFPFWLATCLALGILGAREMLGLLTASGLAPQPPVVLGGIIGLVASNWVPHVTGHLLGTEYRATGAFDALAYPLWTFVAIVMASFLVEGARFRQPGGATLAVAGSLLAVSYVGLLGSFLVQLRWLDGPQWGLVPLIGFIATAKGTDTGAYTLGRLAGRHKLWPVLSPNKTIEGSLGGLAFALGASSLVFGLARWWSLPALGWTGALGFGLVVGIAAQLGDLMESMLKRDSARKDASDTLPGFGGILDLIDSLLFAAPVAYGHWLLFGP